MDSNKCTYGPFVGYREIHRDFYVANILVDISHM